MSLSAPIAPSIRLINALRDRTRYAHSVTSIDILETHISWVILTGSIAYKIKKPVNLGFLDFRTLEARHHYCQEELRLNRRLAPQLYQAVIPITGTPDNPILDGNDPAIEYAVQMRQFEQGALASNLLAQGTLTPTHIEALARLIASFHMRAGIAARGGLYGTAESVIGPVRSNFRQLESMRPGIDDRARLSEIEDWSERAYQECWAIFGARQADGRVRECHGDLHLGNIAMIEHALMPFDCLEFDPALRWIDVMSEVAFVVMDLMDRGRSDLSARFLNAYLESSGDYSGLEVLRFYMAYRAMVRAKVHALRAQQAGLAVDARTRLMDVARGYVALAQRCASDKRPAIILMHGMSGSGKSVVALSLADRMVAIRVRSDVERKRLVGLAPQARSASTPASGLYTDDRTQSTYERLLDLARIVTKAGYPIIVDATFLKFWQRELFRREARKQCIPFLIVDVSAPEAILRARIEARRLAGNDASEADSSVLDHQFTDQESLRSDEMAAVFNFDSTATDQPSLLRRVSEEVGS